MGVAGQSRVNTTRIVLATLFVGGGLETKILEIEYERSIRSEPEQR